MKRVSKVALLVGVAVLVGRRLRRGRLRAGDGNNAQATPKGWNYEIKDGKRVPKAQSRDQCRRQLARRSRARARA